MPRVSNYFPPRWPRRPASSLPRWWTAPSFLNAPESNKATMYALYSIFSHFYWLFKSPSTAAWPHCRFRAQYDQNLWLVYWIRENPNTVAPSQVPVTIWLAHHSFVESVAGFVVSCSRGGFTTMQMRSLTYSATYSVSGGGETAWLVSRRDEGG